MACYRAIHSLLASHFLTRRLLAADHALIDGVVPGLTEVLGLVGLASGRRLYRLHDIAVRDGRRSAV